MLAPSNTKHSNPMREHRLFSHREPCESPPFQGENDLGSTVTTGKQVGAFKARDGQIIYILFEESYEKNVHPHQPSWCAWYMGDAQGAVRAIFRAASSCEGGMLQSRKGCITPESYIAGWLKELAQPYEMPDFQICLETGPGWRMAATEETKPSISAALHAVGRKDLASEFLENGKVSFSLHPDTEAALAVLGAGVSVWKLIPSYWSPGAHSRRNGELAYAPVRSTDAAYVPPNALKADANTRLLQQEDGTWRCAGWQYSAIGTFIAQLAEVELKAPGSYRKRIQAFRDRLVNAPQMPAGTRVAITTGLVTERYARERMERLIGSHPVTQTQAGFEIIPDKESIWDITAIPPEAAIWIPGGEKEFDLPRTQPAPAQASLF